MNNITDLNLLTHILPLFDFTHNEFAKQRLLTLLQSPLSSVIDLKRRQEIIKGFILNFEIIKDYSYARLDFNEVHKFLEDASSRKDTAPTRLKLMFSETERQKRRARLIQFVVLLSRLQNFFLKKINTNFFPEEYKGELVSLNHFLTSFNLNFYDEKLSHNTFKIKHIVELSKTIHVKQAQGEISAFYKGLFLFEAYISIATSICKNGFCFPTFSDSHILLENLYHPLIARPIKNTFETRKNVILLTGPNMSGKSTFLKAVGLCVYLAHVGVGVPASRAIIPFVEHFTVSINPNDDLLNGYSHFMAEVMRLKSVLTEVKANKSCFAVFDELFKGTNIEDAVQISSTTIKGLSKVNNSFFFISTHLHQLKEIDQVKAKQVDTYYLDCEVENDLPVFNYQVKEGWSDLKVGQLLFEKEGLNELLQSNGTR